MKATNPTIVQGKQRGEKMRKIFALFVAIAMCGIFAPLAGASNTATINVTLNPSAQASIVCNQSVWNPSAGIGSNESTSATWGKVSNDGHVAVHINVSATNSGAWTLSATRGHDAFVLKTITPDITLTTSGQVFDADMAPVGDSGHTFTTFGLTVNMPTSTSTATQQHLAITFTATAL